MPGPHAPQGTPLPTNEATGPTWSGASDAASRASSLPRDRPITHGGTSSTPAWARSQSHARVDDLDVDVAQRVGRAGVAPVGQRQGGHAVPGQQRADHRAARPGDRPTEDHHGPARTFGGQEQPARHPRLGHHVLGDAVGPRTARAYDVSTVCSSHVARSVTRIGCSTSQS